MSLKNFVKKSLGLRKLWSKTLGSKKFKLKILGQTKFWSKKIKGPKKIESKKFGQNWVSNNWDIVDMDKYGLDICHHDSWHLIKMVPGTYL